MKKESLLGQRPTLHINTFSVEYDSCVTLRKVLEGSSLEPLDGRFVEKHRKELARYVFVFRMGYEHQHWKLRKRFHELYHFQQNVIRRYGKDIPPFPIKREGELGPHNVQSFGEFLDIFIKRAANTGFYDEEVRNFLDILPDKFGHGIIYGEYPLKKLSGGRYNEVSCCKSLRHLICPCARSWRTRFFTVTDSGVFYTRDRKSYQLKEMLLYCTKFRLFWGIRETGEFLGIELISSTRELTLVARDVSDFALFVSAVGEAMRNSPLAGPQRFDSFAPIREGGSTKFYVDGEGYFADLCDDLLAARSSVHITGWMITPYFQLKRPNPLNSRESRLDFVLQTLSERGVKVYIVLYQEPEMAINNDSKHVEEYLQEMGRNIKVIRHPKYLVIPFLWSHHEKSVIVDQKVAYMGGLDICYGRWDTPAHSLTNELGHWHGADFCNMRISDIYAPRNFLMSNLDDRTQPRMPWHDVAIRIRGEAVHDLTRHFISYWNFVNSQSGLTEKDLLSLSGRQEMLIHHSKVKDKLSKIVPITEEGEGEAVMEEMIEEGQYYQKRIDQSRPMLPVIAELKSTSMKILSLFSQPEEEECLIVTNPEVNATGRHSHQLLRSASRWSIGLLQKESSIHSAYLSLIDTAQRFIYIENQFFICQENQVVERIAERISRAHADGEAFKVVVLIPLLPGFEGDVRESNGAVMRVQLHWEYRTICRSSRSLVSRLKHIPSLGDYLQFYSLRQHGITRELLPMTQILYIHSKLMIVDDQKLIIGSANINDRSLLGDRDSELAMLIEDPQLVENSSGDWVSKDIQSFRVRLYQEHFGLTEKEAEDPMDQSIWQMVRVRAKTNTILYRQLFGCYPDDTMLRFPDIEEVRKKSKPAQYGEKSKDILGHVVELPLKFLEKEELNLSAGEKEYLLPAIFFT